jgi:hypothetical protein
MTLRLDGENGHTEIKNLGSIYEDGETGIGIGKQEV